MKGWSIRRPVNFKVLGYGFVPTYRKGEKGKYQLVASDKSWKNLKQKMKIVTRKTTPMSFDERIQKLKEITRMAQLFPNGEPARQAKGSGRMAQKSASVLYLASLEGPTVKNLSGGQI